MTRNYAILLLSTSFGASPDTPTMINFAQALHINTKQPGIWNSLQTDCCSALGVQCDGNERVITIDWSQKNLDGTIDGNYIPSALVNLRLNLNLLTGKIPSRLPNGIQQLYVYSNRLTGDVPLFPNSLLYLYLGYAGFPGNHFTGTVAINAPLELYITDNWITGIFVADATQLTVNCDLSNNALLGNSGLLNLNSCLKNGLYDANQLPVTITTKMTTTSLSTTKMTTKQLSYSSFILTTTTAVTSVKQSTTTTVRPTTIATTTAVRPTTTMFTSLFVTKDIGASMTTIQTVRAPLTTMSKSIAKTNSSLKTTFILVPTLSKTGLPPIASTQVEKEIMNITIRPDQITTKTDNKQHTTLFNKSKPAVSKKIINSVDFGSLSPITEQSNLFENMGLLIRTVIDYVLFTIVVIKSPFRRELKQKLKGNDKGKGRLDQGL